MERVFIDGKKVGANFTQYNNKCYCVINFNRKNTKFPFDKDIFSSDEKGRNLIEKCVKFCFDNIENFNLKDIKHFLEDILKFSLSKKIADDLNNKLGDLLTYNQFNSLKYHEAFSEFVLEFLLLDELKLKNIISYPYEIGVNSSFIENLNEDLKKEIVIFIVVFRNRIENKMLILEFIDNIDEMIKKLFDMYHLVIKKQISDTFPIELKIEEFEKYISPKYKNIESSVLEYMAYRKR